MKYLPSLFVRKRNDGDNQAVLATRTWGLSSSARTLIYFDDLLISALIGNNNSAARPRSPEFWCRRNRSDGSIFSTGHRRPSAAYSPAQLHRRRAADRLEDPLTIHSRSRRKTVSIMPRRDQYGTKDTYVTSQTSAAAGDRKGPVSFLVSANYLDSYQQPLTLHPPLAPFWCWPLPSILEPSLP